MSKVQAARRLLVCIDDKFLTQVIKALTRGGSSAVLHMYRHVRCKGRSSLSSSDCRMVEFRILRGGKWVKSRTSATEFRRAGCDFRDLLARVP